MQLMGVGLFFGILSFTSSIIATGKENLGQEFLLLMIIMKKDLLMAGKKAISTLMLV